MEELLPQSGSSPKKYPTEYKPDVIVETVPQYYDKYEYGQTIRKLKPGIEVEGVKMSLPVTLSRLATAGTGNQTITGIGFLPKAIKIQTAYISSTDGSLSFGSYNGTTQYVYYTFPNGTSTGASVVQNYIIRVTNDAGVAMTRASISSLSNDGFVINWDTMGLNVTFTYECVG